MKTNGTTEVLWALGLALPLAACDGTEQGDAPDSGAPDGGEELLNQPPIAVDDVAETRERESVDIWLVVNDTDSEGDALIVTEVVQPDNGLVQILPLNERVEYTSLGGFIGVDEFTYTVSDQNGGTDQGAVTVNVTEIPILTLVITNPDEDEAIVGTSVLVSFDVGGCNVSSPSADREGCHLHKFLDGAGYDGGTGGIGHYSPAPFMVTGLAAGSHQVTLELITNSGSDQPVDPYVADAVNFTVTP